MAPVNAISLLAELCGSCASFVTRELGGVERTHVILLFSAIAPIRVTSPPPPRLTLSRGSAGP
ncbi:MAG: hypothetical protein ACRDM1_03100 [Gaiellaceae bacterium]